MKKNNEGFSLVELIVVIAIMAVLVGVLAPAYLRYVEKSRVSTDNSALAEVASAIKTAVAEEDVYASISSNTTLTVDKDGAALTSTSSKLLAEVKDTVGDAITFKSKVYKKQNVIFTVTPGTSDGKVSITQDTYYKDQKSGAKTYTYQ